MRQLNRSLQNTTQAYFSNLAHIKKSKEDALVRQLKLALSPTFLSVQDTTLGANSCIPSYNPGGSMFKIIIESPAFL